MSHPSVLSSMSFNLRKYITSTSSIDTPDIIDQNKVFEYILTNKITPLLFDIYRYAISVFGLYPIVIHKTTALYKSRFFGYYIILKYDHIDCELHYVKRLDTNNVSNLKKDKFSYLLLRDMIKGEIIL